MRRRRRSYYITRKQAKALLEQPDCIRDEDLSALVRRDVYLLSDGAVLIYTGDEVKEVVYRSREALISMISEISMRLQAKSEEE